VLDAVRFDAYACRQSGEGKKEGRDD
jgi:hypothetical protein